jgi:L-2-hydroxyglutarate oxidase LhgO
MTGERIDAGVLVVGAGVVGLAVAGELARVARPGPVVVIERNATFGLETSSRSSEVVHGGLYYEPGSLKARLCLEGADLIVERCARLGIALVPRGKVVIATSHEQEAALERLRANGEACGARGLERWSGARLRRAEPRVTAAAVAALFSPRTAVVDSHELMRSFAVEARAAGAELAYRHRLVGLERHGDTWIAAVVDPEGATLELRARIVVNAAGLASDVVAAMAGIDVDAAGYRLRKCKGDYFALAPRAGRGLARLLYPLPDLHLEGLGVHLTIDVGGQARLGPDATYLDSSAGDLDQLPYRVDEAKLGEFLAAGRRILPWLEPGDLSPERSGIRPKLGGPGDPPRDFVVCHEADRGLGGLVDLVGIESPGLTAAPAIAREVVRVLERDGAISRPRS